MDRIKVFNTGETQEELRAKYNPEGSKLRKMQKRMLDMLLYIDDICKKQNIKWRLDGGNVLGAVRHGGFIPWDDDVDIVLEKQEFNRLVKYLLKNPHPQYVLQCNETDKGFYEHGCVVLRDMKSEYKQDTWVHKARKYKGAQIDIFQYDTHISPFLNKVTQKILFYQTKYYIGRNPYISQFIYWILRYIINPCLKIIGYPFTSGQYYAHSYGRIYSYQLPKDVVYPYKPIDFEGYKFPGPAKPEKLVEIIYSPNYMNLPPVTDRNHHQADYEIWD